MAKYNQVLRVERGLAEVVQKPFPEVGEGFVLVEIEVAPVCTEQKPYSTGFLEWYERNDCLGHEGVGVVVGIGKGVEGIREGARVIVYQGWPCGRCWVCRSRLGPTHCVNFRGFREIEAHNHSQSGGGGFSRFRLAPASMIQAIPDGLSWRHAAGWRSASSGTRTPRASRWAAARRAGHSLRATCRRCRRATRSAYGSTKATTPSPSATRTTACRSQPRRASRRRLRRCRRCSWAERRCVP